MPSKTEHKVLLALGGNMPSSIGGPLSTMKQAIEVLDQTGFSIQAISQFYQTPAFPAGAGPDFVNAALVASTSMPPEEALACLHRVEAKFGRERVARWGTRTLDIDLIAYDDAVLPDQETFRYWLNLSPEKQGTLAPNQLIVPHPRLQDREFVLVPLAEVAPDWRHPILDQTLRTLCDALPAKVLSAVKELPK